MVIVGIKCQNTLLEYIHHVGIRCIHDDVTDEVVREFTIISKNIKKFLKLVLVRQLAEEKKIGDFFKTKAACLIAFNKIHDIIALIIELAINRNLAAMYGFESDDIGDLCQTGKDTFTVGVTQTTFDIVLNIQILVKTP